MLSIRNVNHPNLEQSLSHKSSGKKNQCTDNGSHHFLFTFLMLWRQCRSKSCRRKMTLVKCTDHTVHDTCTSSPSTGHKASQAHSPDDLTTETKLKHLQPKILVMLLDGSSLNYYPKHTPLVSICMPEAGRARSSTVGQKI